MSQNGRFKNGLEILIKKFYVKKHNMSWMTRKKRMIFFFFTLLHCTYVVYLYNI